MIPVGAARKETLAHDEENDRPAKKQTRNKPTKQHKQNREGDRYTSQPVGVTVTLVSLLSSSFYEWLLYG